MWVLVWSRVVGGDSAGVVVPRVPAAQNGGPGSRSSIAPLTPSFAVPVLARRPRRCSRDQNRRGLRGCAAGAHRGRPVVCSWSIARGLSRRSCCPWERSQRGRSPAGPSARRLRSPCGPAVGSSAVTTVAVTGGVRRTGPVPLSGHDVAAAPFVVAGLGIGAMSITVVVGRSGSGAGRGDRPGVARRGGTVPGAGLAGRAARRDRTPLPSSPRRPGCGAGPVPSPRPAAAGGSPVDGAPRRDGHAGAREPGCSQS